MKTPILLLSALFASPLVLQDGYRDTPYLPGGEWRVHDAERPAPPVVTPGSGSGATGVANSEAPSDATVLFDGTSLAAWHSGDEPASWAITEDGALQVGGGTIATVEEFGDCQLHVEWRSPAEVVGTGQGRGNSGVFLMGIYEIQVLDSYENSTYADGQAAALYGQYPPQVNASRPPGEWQSYDIVFRAPRFGNEDSEGGQPLLQPAQVTVFHNGVCVHDARELLGKTAHRSVAQYEAHAPVGPIALQDHGNPVEFRNIWVRPLAAR